MAIGIADNFLYQGRKPLDSRIVKDTIADMTAMAESIIYDGIMVYNKETSKFYVFNSSNTVDATLSKWRELETGAVSTANAVIEDYKQNTDYKKNTLIIYDNKVYLVSLDFKSDNTEATIADSFKSDLDSGNLIPVDTDTDVDTHSVDYKQAEKYEKGNLLVLNSKLYITLQDFTANDTEATVEDSLEKDIILGNITSVDTNIDTNCIEYAQNQKYTTEHIIRHNNKIYVVASDFISNSTEANSDLGFEKDLQNGMLIPVVTETKISKVLAYTQATKYDKDTLVYIGNKIARVDIDYTSDATEATIEQSFDLDVANSHLVPISAEDIAAVLPYAQDTDYLENTLVFLGEKIARVENNYHSDNTVGSTVHDSFEDDIKNKKISLINTDHVTIMNDYAQSNMYFKDTLIYHDKLIGRVMNDFIADSSVGNSVDDSFDVDITNGNILILNKEAEPRNFILQTKQLLFKR